jgi:hypothetical protein
MCPYPAAWTLQAIECMKRIQGRMNKSVAVQRVSNQALFAVKIGLVHPATPTLAMEGQHHPYPAA